MADQRKGGNKAARGEATVPIDRGAPWLLGRMAGDDWLFGLLTTDGTIIVITKVDKIHHTPLGNWMDVQLATADDLKLSKTKIKRPCFTAPTERTTASINLANIVAGFDMQGSHAVAHLFPEE